MPNIAQFYNNLAQMNAVPALAGTPVDDDTCNDYDIVRQRPAGNLRDTLKAAFRAGTANGKKSLSGNK